MTYWMRCYDRNDQYVGRYETYDHDRTLTLDWLPRDFTKYPLVGRPLDINDYFAALAEAVRRIDPHADYQKQQDIRNELLKNAANRADANMFVKEPIK